MEQTSSNKVISLHLEKCFRDGCKNHQVCYHSNKTLFNSIIFQGFSYKDRETILKAGNIIHESICNKILWMHWFLLKRYKNYNITIPCELYQPFLDDVVNQVQISVYNLEQVYIFKEYQKLFLIKDSDTFTFFLDNYDKDLGKMHYLLDRNFVSDEVVRKILQKYISCKVSEYTTIDSCFMSNIINKTCPNSNGNYMDITYDGSVRSCSYEKISDVPFLGSLYGLQNPPPVPTNCKYIDFR